MYLLAVMIISKNDYNNDYNMNAKSKLIIISGEWLELWDVITGMRVSRLCLSSLLLFNFYQPQKFIFLTPLNTLYFLCFIAFSYLVAFVVGYCNVLQLNQNIDKKLLGLKTSMHQFSKNQVTDHKKSILVHCSMRTCICSRSHFFSQEQVFTLF